MSLLANGAEAFLAEWTARADDRTRCLKRWTEGSRIGLLVAAPDDYDVRARGPHLCELTELLAPAGRWMEYDAIDLRK